MKQFNRHLTILGTRHLFFLLAGMVVLHTSCQKKELGDTGSSAQNLSNFDLKQIASPQALPFKGTFSLSLSNDPVFTGTGEGTLMGTFSVFIRDDESNFPEITGIATFTAANGDQIFSTHSGPAEILGNGFVSLVLQNTITGGTGRFSNATGRFITMALANENIGTAKASFNGIINF